MFKVTVETKNGEKTATFNKKYCFGMHFGKWALK